MNTVSPTKPKPKSADVEFPLMECWNPLSKVATIAATQYGKRVLCKISLKVLKARFNASEESVMDTVACYRQEIRAAAKTLIEERAFEKDGTVNILLAHLKSANVRELQS